MSAAFSGPSSPFRRRLGNCLEEVARGVGNSWARYRVVGATRAGIAPAKEPVGKNPERYKLVEPGTIFYNPMRILLGSIAMIDDGQEPGITSPDYVVFRSEDGVVHPRWLYYWLRSPDGAAFIKTLARGAVRERLLFRRLAVGDIDVPPYAAQQGFAAAMLVVARARAATEAKLEAAHRLPVSQLRATFSSVGLWPVRPLGEMCQLLPSRSVSTAGSRIVRVVTTACLKETGFDPAGVKAARMMEDDALESRLALGEILVARSNTPDLVGRVAVYRGEPSDVVASDLTIRLMPRQGISSDFLASYLSYLYLTGYWKERAGGASGSMKKITRTQLLGESVPVPSLPEQEEVIRRLDDRIRQCRSILDATGGALTALNSLPTALLRQAFRGEL